MFRYAVQSERLRWRWHQHRSPTPLRGGVDSGHGDGNLQWIARHAARGGRRRSHKVDGDRTAGVIAESASPRLQVPTLEVPYGLGEAIRVEIDFRPGRCMSWDPGEDLTLRIFLSVRTCARCERSPGGSGTDTLTFRYVVQSDDYDDDGISIGANALQGGRHRGCGGEPGSAHVRQVSRPDSRHRVDGLGSGFWRGCVSFRLQPRTERTA